MFVGLREILQTVSSSESGVSSKYFTRKGPLTLPILVALLLTMVSNAGKDGYGLILLRFWSAARFARIKLGRKEAVTAPAFCEARKKLPWTFMLALLHEADARLHRAFGAKFLWKGRRIFAVDGAKIPLLRDPKLFAEFGSARGAGRPMTTVSVILDVLSRAPVTVTIGRHASSERAQLLELLDSIPRGSILIFDRGYPGFALLCELRRRGIHFVARSATRSCFGAVTEFLRSGRDHARIALVPTRRFAKRLGLPPELRVRALRVRGGKEQVVLLTSLSGQEAKRGEVIAFYRWRWNIESSFKILKVDGFGLDSLHSKTVDGVKQEIVARLLFMALSQHVLAQAAKWFRKPFATLSSKAARSELDHTEILLILTLGASAASVIVATTLNSIGRSHAERRKGRHFPRVSHKPSPRWDATGKTSRRGH